VSEFSKRLKRLREGKGLSRRQLETAADIPHGIVSRLESDAREYPSVPVAKKLAKVLGVTLDYLCGMYEGLPLKPASGDRREGMPPEAVVCSSCRSTVTSV
jgi:transcriptional regulator with XRE-family HTH domain